MGCDMAQGYHFSRPLGARAIVELLRDQPFMNKE
jgi:EAL domain-containing protein (putative c-di-GMP-specific phosphodiesterase class I)